MITLKLTPRPKPRMTKKSVWKHMDYFKWAGVLKAMKPEVNWIPLSIQFVLPMPKSWPEKKKKLFDGTEHLPTPDLDNMIKAIKDSLLKNDSKVWCYGEMSKVWGREGLIIFDPPPLSLDQYQTRQL